MISKLYHLEQDRWQEQCQPTSGVTSFTVQWEIIGERSWIHPRSEDSHSPCPRTMQVHVPFPLQDLRQIKLNLGSITEDPDNYRV